MSPVDAFGTQEVIKQKDGAEVEVATTGWRQLEDVGMPILGILVVFLAMVVGLLVALPAYAFMCIGPGHYCIPGCPADSSLLACIGLK